MSDEANPTADGHEPVLRVPEERTVLPDVDRAMPVLETISDAVSRKRGRFNVAVLKSLQESGTGRWKIKEIQDALDWLEPQSATDLVSGLRGDAVLRYDKLANRYSMPPEVRAASAVMDALTASCFVGASRSDSRCSVRHASKDRFARDARSSISCSISDSISAAIGAASDPPM